MRKIRRKWIAASAALCATLALSTALVNSMFCFGLYLDGEEIGKAVNIFEVETIVASAEEQLTELLGYECSVNYALSLAAVTEAVPADIGEIEKAIITSVGGVEEKYVLTVDGEIVGAADEEEALTELLDEVLDKYTSDATASVRILSDVTIAQQYVTGDVVSDPERVKALIEPGNSDSAYSLAVENVESVLISEEIPFKTEFVEDDTLYEGESVVLCEGESGAVLFAERTVLLNGVEQSREQMGRIVAKEPVTEVVAVGTRSLTASTGSYSWPAQGIITAWFGYRQTSVGNSDHKGLDIAGQYGQSIYAADGGEVIFAGWTDGYGYFVQIRHDNGEVTCYGHNCGLLVSTGELVRQGQEIARMGSTGISTGVHCHFEIRIDGVAVDPSKYLS